MTALTANRNTPARDSKQFSFPVAASTKIYQGSLVCINASSLAVPGSVATTQKCVGRADEIADNSAGLASAINVPVSRGCFRFGNSASTDAIALKDVGASCYIVDDQTVAKTDGTGARSIAGVIRDVDADGVWVEI
jgi:hypothetical protein